MYKIWGFYFVSLVSLSGGNTEFPDNETSEFIRIINNTVNSMDKLFSKLSGSTTQIKANLN